MPVVIHPPFRMCFWFAQMCEDCERITLIPWEKPIGCENRCERKIIDPNNLTDEDREQFLDYTGRCCKHCEFDDCGVYVRLVNCGDEYALSKTCKEDKESDVESVC